MGDDLVSARTYLRYYGVSGGHVLRRRVVIRENYNAYNETHSTMKGTKMSENVTVITDAPKPARFNKKMTTLGAVALGIAAAGLLINDKLKKQADEAPVDETTEA